jgi:hypothetical protein
MSGDGTWPIRIPIRIEVIECFVSKTVWHSKYMPNFSKVKKYADLEEWLLNGPQALDDIEMFGYEKIEYTIPDIVIVLAELERADKKIKVKGTKRARGDVGDVGREKKKMKASGSKPHTS